MVVVYEVYAVYIESFYCETNVNVNEGSNYVPTCK